MKVVVSSGSPQFKKEVISRRSSSTLFHLANRYSNTNDSSSVPLVELNQAIKAWSFRKLGLAQISKLV